VCVRGQKGGISLVEVVNDFATHSKIPSPLVPSGVSFLPNEEKVLAGSKAKQMIKRNPSSSAEILTIRQSSSRRRRLPSAL